MKSVVVSAVIAAVVVVGSLCYSHNLEKVSGELSDINENIRQLLREEDYVNASSQVERMKSYLDQKRPVLAAIGNHEELDTIEMNLSELMEYSVGENKTDALSICRVLGFMFEHLPENYKLKWENIL